MKIKLKSLLKFLLFLPIIGVIIFFSFYSWWNSAKPEKTCMSCHEISGSVMVWQTSVHRNIACKECHGTALSNGFHSLKEKAKMVTTHMNKKVYNDEVKMNEEQILETMERCAQCHQSEFSAWKSGGHSAKYADIFLNQKHNTTERLNFDCLRCHGMFYGGTINDLVSPIDQKGPWKLKNQELNDKPAIPCMACHHIHYEGVIAKNPDYSNPREIKYKQPFMKPSVSFYNRPDQDYFHASLLPKGEIWNGDSTILVSDDERQRVCLQCHAPNAWHQSQTSDDRTPTGVHEGLSCLACHAVHSNKSGHSCANCHPALSNCGIPVETMNTTFKDINSPNNIHFVKCRDCHKNYKPKKKNTNENKTNTERFSKSNVQRSIGNAFIRSKDR